MKLYSVFIQHTVFAQSTDSSQMPCLHKPMLHQSPLQYRQSIWCDESRYFDDIAKAIGGAYTYADSEMALA